MNNLSCPPFIEKVVVFPEGASYELVRPLTDFKRCHDGTPAEDRIVFIGKQVGQDSEQDNKEEFVVKVKVQTLENSQNLETGPSTTTSAELEALTTFLKANNTSVPHLVSWKQTVQGPDAPSPGGYVTYTVMTKMPGQTLFGLQYWTLPTEEREQIVQGFLLALRSIYDLGIEPIDCALRNVMWDQETKKCTIIDFELWRETKEPMLACNETRELQRWGLARRPAPQNWWDEWNLHFR